MKKQKDLSSLGKRIVTDIQRVPQHILDGFANLSSTDVADVVGKLYTMNSNIRPLYPNAKSIVGSAVTVRCIPGDNLMTHAALTYLQPGDVLVCDARGDREYCLGGALVCSIAQSKGAVGFILDGTYRDSNELEEIDFPVYALGLQARPPAKNGPGEINTSIYCGGVPVHPGDIVIADHEGIAVVPQEYAEAVLKATIKRAKADEDRWADLDEWERYHTERFDEIIKEQNFSIE